MKAADHRVRRQRWRLATHSTEEAFALRTQLRAALERELPAALERAFDKVAPGAAVRHIPRLELRLRVASFDALAGALADAIARELDFPPAVLPRQSATDRLQILRHYLEHGALAWHAAHRDAPEAAAELRAAALAELAEAVRRAPSGPASFARLAQYFFRLLGLLPAEHWPELGRAVDAAAPAAAAWLEITPTGSADATASVVRAVIGTLAGAAPAPPLYEVTMVVAVMLAAVRERTMHGADLARAVGIALGIGVQAPEERDEPAPESGGTINPELASLLARLPGPVAAFFAARFAGPPDPPSEGRRAMPPAPCQAKLHTRRPGAPGDAAVEAPAGPKLAPGEQLIAARPFAWFVPNAGLVLLHPYLPRLFEHCELYRERRLRGLPRAAALLHWLAVGREELHEFELGFAKLLLGLAPDAPLAVGAGLLGARERDEGDALLRAAIGHWRALRSTSVEALRLCFLQRRGALREDEAGWRLELEPEAFDVLLARLPWTITTLRLPWMTRPLYTDWPTP